MVPSLFLLSRRPKRYAIQFDSLLDSPSGAKEAGIQTSGGYIAGVFFSMATGFYRVTSICIANLVIPIEAIEAVAVMET